MKESHVLIITALLNAAVAVIKLLTGVAFSFSTLIADSIQSFIDFFTDIVSLVANRIGKRRANKTYPFGYGQVYYLSNILTGLLLFFIGVFIVYQVIAVDNKFIKNELLIESYKESSADFISTCAVIIVLLISYFEKYMPEYINIDKIGSTCMAIYVFYTSIKMIVSNIKGILVNDEENDDVKDKIKKDLERFKGIKITSMRIIKMSSYYSVFLQIDVDDDLTIREFLIIQEKIKRKLRAENKLIKYIDIEPI